MSRLRAHKSRLSGLTACKQSEAATAPYSAGPFLTRVPHSRRRSIDAHEFGPAQYMNSTSTNHPITLHLTPLPNDGHLIGSDPKTVRVSTPRCIFVKLDRQIPLHHHPTDISLRQNHIPLRLISLYILYTRTAEVSYSRRRCRRRRRRATSSFFAVACNVERVGPLDR